MKYMGSKNRIAKYIIPIILSMRESNDQIYVEPFVGGANVIDKIPGKRIGADTNKYLIAFYQSILDGWVPPKEVSEQEYKSVKNNLSDYDDNIIGYVGFAMSYGGKFFGGYRRDTLGARNYSDEAFRSYEKQLSGLVGINFVHASYEDLDIPKKSIIYCDPPYKGTTCYMSKFDNEKYYAWLRYQKKLGHTVICSEYVMPEDFKIVWAKEITSSLTRDSGSKKGIEKLFIL